MSFHAKQCPEATRARQRWMRAFALADENPLRLAVQSLGSLPAYSFLRKPEAGMLMLEARAGSGGQRFNLGEMLVTRCTVSLAGTGGDGGILEGHAYIAGNHPRQAELAALLDALMQQPEHAGVLEDLLVRPLLAGQEKQRRETEAETARTKVDFFTLVRGEDA